MSQHNLIERAQRTLPSTLRWRPTSIGASAKTLTFFTRRITFFSKNVRILCWAALSSLCCTVGVAQDTYREQMKGLDEQVQAIKSDVLSIDAELSRLEEKLLYPSDTQLALFVAIPKDDPIRLDAVQIHIDGQPVARYVYSYKELEALQKGGMQRIYTGNVTTGSHQLDISFIAKVEGKEYSQSGQFTIKKGIQPKLVGITVAGPASGKAAIDIGEW